MVRFDKRLAAAGRISGRMKFRWNAPRLPEATLSLLEPPQDQVNLPYPSVLAGSVLGSARTALEINDPAASAEAPRVKPLNMVESPKNAWL
jgi:hypothetical protein